MIEVATSQLDAPFGSLLAALARAVAQGQATLDCQSVLQAEHFAGFAPQRDEQTGTLLDEHGHPSSLPVLVDTRIDFGGGKIPLMAAGFIPAFYSFVETVIEVRIDVRMRRRPTGAHELRGAPIDARYQARYGVQAHSAAILRASIVPVPGPDGEQTDP